MGKLSLGLASFDWGFLSSWVCVVFILNTTQRRTDFETCLFQIARLLNTHYQQLNPRMNFLNKVDDPDSDRAGRNDGKRHPETSKLSVTSIVCPITDIPVEGAAKVEIGASSHGGGNDSEGHTGICEKAAVVEP